MVSKIRERCRQLLDNSFFRTLVTRHNARTARNISDKTFRNSATRITAGNIEEVAFVKNNTSVSLSGDTVKVFFLKESSFEPLRVAKESAKP